MDVCVLSIEEAARFENYGYFPIGCRNGAHQHVSKTIAAQMVADDTHRALESISAITPIEQKTWAPRPSGHPLGPKVWQMQRQKRW